MNNKSPKSALTALFLCLFFGILGAHRFYVGKKGTGLLMLITLGGIGIWVIVDIVRIACNEFKDKNGDILEFNNLSTFKKALLAFGSVIATIVVLIIMLILLAFYLTSGLVTPINSQLAALRTGDIPKAYSYTSKDFQKVTSIDDFKKFLTRYPSLKNNESASFNEREFENNEGIVRGTLKAKDGAITPIKYRLVKENNEWKILGIQVTPTGAGVKVTDENQSKKISDNNRREISLPNTYDDTNNKFAVNYPADWEFEQPANGKVLFSGKKGTASYQSVINIQTLPSKKIGGNYSNVKEVMDDLKKQITNKTSNLQVLGTGPIQLTKDGKQLPAEVFVFNYTYQKQDFRQMLVVVGNPDNRLFYAWTYNAPTNQYALDLSIAQAMFQSWIIK